MTDVLKQRDLDILHQFDKLGALQDSLKISDLNIEFYNKIKQYLFFIEDRKNLIKMWDTKVLNQLNIARSKNDRYNKTKRSNRYA